MKVLSLYDGMSCGSIAFKNLGIEVDEYIAYEIDKYAIAVTQHNFPNVIQMGDVYGADFTQHKDIDWLIGGFPCTKFSIAQKNDRETEPYSGLGWELFMHYKRALNEAKPKYFLAENNKSMAKPIRDEISRLFGFEPTCINSALVSAQNRQRLYWVGKREPDGTYSKVDVQQPEDKEILLRDVLDNAVAWQEKAYALTTRCSGAIPEDTLSKHRHTMCAEPVNVTTDGKAQTLRATCYKDGIRNMVGNNIDKKTCIAEPVCVAQRGRYSDIGEILQHYEPREDGKTNAITTVQKDNAVAEPVCIQEQVFGRKACDDGSYDRRFEAREDSKSGTLTPTMRQNAIAEPIQTDERGKSRPLQASYYKYAASDSVKSTNPRTGVVEPYDGKTQPIYQVLNGLITIKDKQYPIKLADGFYIIRKLTVSECKRLQTVPEWYDFSVISNSQAYKCLGNGWSCSVIEHLIESAVNT